MGLGFFLEMGIAEDEVCVHNPHKSPFLDFWGGGGVCPTPTAAGVEVRLGKAASPFLGGGGKSSHAIPGLVGL